MWADCGPALCRTSCQTRPSRAVAACAAVATSAPMVAAIVGMALRIIRAVRAMGMDRRCSCIRWQSSLRGRGLRPFLLALGLGLASADRIAAGRRHVLAQLPAHRAHVRDDLPQLI